MYPARQPTIIIADNYEDTRLILRRWLESRGCRVVEAANGQEAFERASDEGEHPDLVLLALRMPLVDGFEVARRLRERGREYGFPIVAMYTYLSEEALDSALAAGYDSLVAQPFDFELLSELLCRLVPGLAVELAPVTSYEYVESRKPRYRQ